MAFGRLERARSAKPMSDINMTPLIDVMLVLLVIFIIAAPLMTSGLQLDLPDARAAQPTEGTAPLAVSIDPQGALYLGGEALADEPFAARLAAAAKARPDAELQLRADRTVPYGRVAQVIDLAQQAGLRRIGFITETAASSPSR